MRKELGRQLAREQPAEADLVIPVPDSGVPAALGFAEESGLPFDFGLIRNHYVGRTFIEPQDAIRHFGVKVKLNAQREVLEGKRVVVVDDSIVRGTTSRKIVTMLRAAGAARGAHAHQLAADDRPLLLRRRHADALRADRHRPLGRQTIREFITADSLGFLSEAGALRLHRRRGGDGFCDACFTGRYPIPVVGRRQGAAAGAVRSPRSLTAFARGTFSLSNSAVCGSAAPGADRR